MRPWIAAIGVVLLVAAGIGLVSAALAAPACALRGPARLGGAEASAEQTCAAAEEDAAGALVLGAAGLAALVLGAVLPSKAPAPASTACPACGRRVAAAHGFCPACGAAR